MIELFSFVEVTYTPITSNDCYEPDGWFDIAFGIFLTIGIWVSWLPQQVEFYRKKSTFGVSSLYIILTQIANWTPFINALYLDWDTFKCCKYINFWECQESLITIYQLGISTFSVFCIYIFYVIYYTPTDTSKATQVHEENKSINNDLDVDETTPLDDKALLPSKEDIKKGKRKQIIFFIIYHICTAIVIFIGYMMIAIWGPYSTSILWYAYILGLISAVVVLVQFSPQIYITYKLKTSGSLSLVMLVIQTPGTWVWLVYLVAAGENWSTWLSTLVAAIQVTILLCQVLYYDYIKSRRDVIIAYFKNFRKSKSTLQEDESMY